MGGFNFPILETEFVKIFPYLVSNGDGKSVYIKREIVPSFPLP